MTNWIPKFIRLRVQDRPKKVVNAEYWNSLWNLVIEQGDHNAEGIYRLITGEYGYNYLLKKDFDKDNDGIIDNAQKVNNHTVESDVPENAVFSDTTYQLDVGTEDDGSIYLSLTDQSDPTLSSKLKLQAEGTVEISFEEDSKTIKFIASGIDKQAIHAILAQAKEEGLFDGEDATIKVGMLGNMKEVPELNIIQVTEKEYNDMYAAGTLDPDAVYVTPVNEITTIQQVVESTEDSGTNVIRITTTDGNSTEFVVRNGSHGYTPVKGVDYFDGKDGKDATVKIGPVSDLKELPELKIYQVTQEEYNDFYEAGSLDPDAVYVTPDSEYLTEETDPTVPSWAKAPTKPSYTASEVGADVSGTAESKVSAHNVSPTAHDDIRLLIQDITTQLANFLDVDDTTVDQLSEVLTLINNNKGTLESLTTSKINVSAIVDNLTTADASKVLSAKQGVAIKSLIDALQTALDTIQTIVTSHTGDKNNPHGVTAEQVGAYTKSTCNTLFNRKSDDCYLEINNNATGTGDCKFATVDYSECDSNNGVSALIRMRSGHGNGKSFIFSQDVYIHVNYDGTVRVDNHKHYDSYVGKYDDVNHQYGDIFWVIDTDNKIVDFYCLVGQWTRLYMTPWKRIANSTKGTFTQHTTRILYSEGTKEWANNSVIPLKSDIPSWALKSTKPTYTADEVGARPNTWTPSASDIGINTEEWTFTLEDGSTVTKQVHIG